jgi:hypothetical protein
MKPLCIHHGISRENAAYLAGILDGEGTVSVSRTSTNQSAKACKRGFAYRSSIGIALTDENLLLWVQQVTGVGRICRVKSQSPKHKAAWRWTAWSKDAVYVAKMVLPYLRLKKRQAENLIAFQAVMRFPGSKGLSDVEWTARHTHYLVSRNLNQRGVAA